MAASFPGALPSFTNPTATDYLNSPAHATQHSSANDELVAVATKVGADSSAVNTTHDYKLSGVADGDKAVSLTGTETLTNKTLTKPTINGSVGAYTADSDAATITFDMAASNVHAVTLGGNRTLAVSNVSVGQCFILRLLQDGTGSRTVTWFTTIKWAGGSAPTLTTTASKADAFGFICTSAGNYDGYIIGQNI